VLNVQSSDWEKVLSGVPQGSVLGPPLFTIYIDDIDDIVRFIKILRKFSDDTKLGHSVATPEDRGRLQLALTKLCEWARTWGMEFNIKKCKVMHLGHNNTEQAYFMEGQQLEVTEVERDIGVNVVKGLKQASQCQKSARTAQGVLSQITRAFHYRDRNVFLRLYIQYVRPHLEYASPAWSPWLEADKEVMEKVQRRAVNMISGLKAKTYEEKLRELGLTTLEERRHQTDMAQVYKIITGKDMVNSEFWFQKVDGTERLTRSAADPLNLRPQAARLEVRRNFFSNRTVEDWNKLPSEVKNVRTVAIFKDGYAKHRVGLVESTD
jgi:ribonucleases P/MRP protein subunit RPP40